VVRARRYLEPEPATYGRGRAPVTQPQAPRNLNRPDPVTGAPFPLPIGSLAPRDHVRVADG